MKTYLVGGAVRDHYLGYPIKERDWVVVGATSQQMLEHHFKQVGKDFPVFLHPDTHEEYALARTERKTSPGYHGFTCDAHPDVTLEEDLARRDLTINAMAMDETGKLHDPYGGLADLNAKRLRHVSPAFIEDPVRVLRVARFAARYHHLGFTVADDTRVLMYQMMKRGELSHLVAERTWQECLKGLHEKNPEQFFITLRACGALKVIFPEFDALFGIPILPIFSPSIAIDAGMRMLECITQVAAHTEDTLLRFSSLVLYIGASTLPIQQWPCSTPESSYNAHKINDLAQRLRLPSTYRTFALLIARFYPVIHRLNQLTADQILDTFEHANAFRAPHIWTRLVLLVKIIDEQVNTGIIQRWQDLLTGVSSINIKDLANQGHDGKTMRAMLRSRRIDYIQSRINWDPNEA